MRNQMLDKKKNREKEMWKSLQEFRYVNVFYLQFVCKSQAKSDISHDHPWEGTQNQAESPKDPPKKKKKRAKSRHVGKKY